jgi:hypothetical protein
VVSIFLKLLPIGGVIDRKVGQAAMLPPPSRRYAAATDCAEDRGSLILDVAAAWAMTTIPMLASRSGTCEKWRDVQIEPALRRITDIH